MRRGAVGNGVPQATVQPAVQDQRVDIGGAANGRRIAENRRDFFHRGSEDGALRAFTAFLGQRRAGEHAGRLHGATPGAEILGAEGVGLLAAGFAQIVVNLAGVDGLMLAGIRWPGSC